MRSFRHIAALVIGFFFLGTIAVLNFSMAEASKDRRKSQTKSVEKLSAQAEIAPIVINELDADQDGTDTGEFVELKAAPGTSLNGYVLVFYNGTSDVSYAAHDLDGYSTDGNGFFILGNAGVAGVDLVIANSSLQNDNDAVALYLGDATSFPTGTAVTTANLVDAVVYDTSDPDDAGLLPLLNPGSAQVQVNENEYGKQITHSVRRCSDATRDGRAFSVGLPTPNAVNSNCPDGKVDINGDGRTDYLIIRPIGGGAAGVAQTDSPTDRFRGSMRDRLQNGAVATNDNALAGATIQWWGLNSNDFAVSTVDWGDYLTDYALTADFDGDGSDDITVWRPVPEGAYFFSLDSSDFTFRQVRFGQEFDNPYIVGDFDGDGTDDPAVFRCPQNAPGTCHFHFRPSSIPNPGDWAVGWGFGQGMDLLPYPGDFNGDGKQDFAVQGATQNNPDNGIFWILLNGSFEVSAVEWGLFTDRLVSGDFDGDGKSDITVARIDENDIWWWYVLEQDGGMRFVPWGNGFDLLTPGDYDGDGQDDFAVYHEGGPNATFWVQPSNGSSHFVVPWGAPGDYPVARLFVQ